MFLHLMPLERRQEATWHFLYAFAMEEDTTNIAASSHYIYLFHLTVSSFFTVFHSSICSFARVLKQRGRHFWGGRKAQEYRQIDIQTHNIIFYGALEKQFCVSHRNEEEQKKNTILLVTLCLANDLYHL